MPIETIQIGGVGVRVRSWQAVLFGLVLLAVWWLVYPMIFGGAGNVAGTGDATVHGSGIANTGSQVFEKPVTIGLTADQVGQMMADVLQKDSLNAKQAAEYKQKVGLLSKEIGVRKPAVENFLRILGEAKVPIEDLGSKLAEIAQRHRDMLDRWSVLEDDDDPAIRERTDAARAAIGDGDYDRADALLAEAEDMDLAAGWQARALEDQAKQAADRRFLSAAAKRAKRGELRLTRLDYPGAAKHFGAAAETVPTGKELVRAGYLVREGAALDYAGKYWEAEKSVEAALTIREKALGRDHPDVAGSLNNLAVLYYHQGAYQKAAEAFERIITIFEKALGPDHPNLAVAMGNYAVILGKLDRSDDAAQWAAKAEAIRKSRPIRPTPSDK